MGTTHRIKSNGFLALPVAQKSVSSTGGGPSGEFGASNNSPRAGPNHPRGVRTEYNRRLDRRRPPGGAAPPTRVRGWSVVLGLVYRSPHVTLLAAQCRRAAATRSIARENGVAFNPLREASS
jgi:hypothetical protein